MTSLALIAMVFIALVVILLLIEKNLYSLILFCLFGGSIVYGAVQLYNLNFWGFIPFAIGGVLMYMGLKGPKSTTESPSKKVWLVTFLGKPTSVKVERTSLFLDWDGKLNLVGFVEFDTKQIDKDFPLKKPIRCKDNAYIYGYVSVSLRPAYEDTPNKSGGKRLQELANVDGIEGVIKQLDDILITWVQEDYGNKENSEFLERRHIEISKTLHNRIIHGEMINRDNARDIDDTTGFGIEIPKLQVAFKPADEVIKARNNLLVELAQKPAELQDTATMNQQIEERIKSQNAHKARGEKRMTYKEARQQIYKEKALKEGVLQIIENPGGVNIADVNKMKGGKS